MFGIGDKLFQIRVTLEVPELDQIDGELLEEDTNKDKQDDTNKEQQKYAPPNINGVEGNGPSVPSFLSDSLKSTSSIGNQFISKYAALQFLHHLEDPLPNNNCFNLLREMELVEKDSADSELGQSDSEDDGEDVAFSPTHAMVAPATAPPIQNAAEILPQMHKKNR